MRRRVWIAAALVLSEPAASFACTARAPTPPAPAGQVRYVKRADASYDRVTRAPSGVVQRRIQRSFWRAEVFTPYWHERSRWYGDGWVYVDLYAIYRSSSRLRRHPEWILRDTKGNPLSIPFNCQRGRCPQWAGDITNPAFRRQWISDARAELAGGRYRGLWIDDVNLDLRVSDATGRGVLPVDFSTGGQLTEQGWREAVADFVTEIRAALPKDELVHNAIWFAGGERRAENPAVLRARAAADWVNLERGVNDPGLTGGTGPYSLSAFLAYIDGVHRSGQAVVLGSDGAAGGRGYALAAYLLINDGQDALSAEARTAGGSALAEGPGLGAPKGARYRWRGLLRRDFARGFVLLNEPGAPRRRVPLGGRWQPADGGTRTDVTLGAASGVVLER